MFENMKSLKLIILLLTIYSTGATVFVIQKNSFSSSSNYSEQIAQLNAQISQQNIQINALQKDNEDLKAVRALMEKERAEKEAGKKLHERSLSGVRDPFEGLDKYRTTGPKW